MKTHTDDQIGDILLNPIGERDYNSPTLPSLLHDGCNNIRDYEIRREFYGYLTKGRDGIADDQEISDFEVGMGSVTNEYAYGADLGEGDVLNLNIFEDIHIGMSPLLPTDVSIFNLLDDDLHCPDR